MLLLGIDVGGTFTDAVLIEKERVLAQAKAPTTHEDVLEGILAALDKALAQVDGRLAEIGRAVISSTIVTNALTEGKLAPAFLAVITGPGMNVSRKFPVEPFYISGYVDHRGQITAQPDLARLRQHLAQKKLQNLPESAAASCKFAVREPLLEQQLGEELRRGGCREVFLGSELSGELNFIRRTNSAYFAAQVSSLFKNFCGRVQAALAARKITAPVHILKADGGTLPLAAALRQPAEAVFTGPAASVLGVEALAAAEDCCCISLDVGGTTTDIAFWENGRPLMARRGAKINGYDTAVRAFHMRSVGIGGDSKVTVSIVNGERCYFVGPQRLGTAAALGGSCAAPTLSDALITAGCVRFGDEARARAAVAALCCPDSGVSLEDGFLQAEAAKIVQAAVRKITGVIAEMLAEWARQPVYTVDDVIRGTEFVPAKIIGVGGGSLGLVKAVGDALGLPTAIPRGAMVANAIGAALARPTLAAGLRADTTENYYLIPESGSKEPLPPRFDQTAAEKLLSNWLRKQAADWQLPDLETELTSCEHFRTVHGYYDTGDIYSLRMQLKPGILGRVSGFEGEVEL